MKTINPLKWWRYRRQLARGKAATPGLLKELSSIRRESSAQQRRDITERLNQLEVEVELITRGRMQ